MTDLTTVIAREALRGGPSHASATEWSTSGPDWWSLCEEPGDMMIVLAHCDPPRALSVACQLARWSLAFLPPGEDAPLHAVQAVECSGKSRDEWTDIARKFVRGDPCDVARMEATYARMAVGRLAMAAAWVGTNDCFYKTSLRGVAQHAAAAPAHRSYAEMASAKGISYEDMWESGQGHPYGLAFSRVEYDRLLRPWNRDVCAVVRMHAACPTVRA